MSFVLNPLGDAHHGLHCFHRVASRGRFRRKHDRISTINHRIRDIQDFCACRQWVFDHRFHHLRGGDDRFT
ncbi:Uncharacterised protein [Vibrio cholerae]|nr:Uncharacterised protein [Vibrio cholerae]